VQYRMAVALGKLGRKAARHAAGALVLLSLCFVGVAAAQDEGVLVRMLQTGKDFRVRAQAAFALGRKQNPSFAPVLEQSLRDKHAVVRAAAASALGRIAALRSMAPLKAASADSESAVVDQARAAMAAIERVHAAELAKLGKTGPETGAASAAALAKSRYVLVVGKASNESQFGGPDLARVLGVSLQRELSALRTVAVFPETDTKNIEAAKLRGLPVLRIDGNVTHLERDVVDEQVSVHAEISLLVMGEGDRNLRTVLKGAATGIEPSMGSLPVIEKRLAQKAVDGAVRSALRNASSAIESAAARVVGARTDTATASLHAH
jgi:HEAT repeats